MSLRLSQLSRRVLQNIFHSNYAQPLDTYLAKRWAGHAKWQNTKADKEQSAKFKSMHFSRLIKDISLAVKEGGENPSTNPKLRNLIEAARKISMTNASIQRAIDRGKTKTGGRSYWVGCKGPLNIQVGFEVTYSQQAVFQSECGSKLKKIGLKIEKNFYDIFVEKGIIVCKPLNNPEGSFDKALEDGLDVEASDVFEMEDKTLVFECAADRVDSTESQLSKKGYTVESSGTEIEFHEMVNLDKNELEKIKAVLDRIIESHDEVQRFSHNIKVQ